MYLDRSQSLFYFVLQARVNVPRIVCCLVDQAQRESMFECTKKCCCGWSGWKRIFVERITALVHSPAEKENPSSTAFDHHLVEMDETSWLPQRHMIYEHVILERLIYRFHEYKYKYKYKDMWFTNTWNVSFMVSTNTSDLSTSLLHSWVALSWKL